MFGKGVYFADMSSKSANYCCANQSNSEGVMLLSEVALGDMHELRAAIERLPKVCIEEEKSVHTRRGGERKHRRRGRERALPVFLFGRAKKGGERALPVFRVSKFRNLPVIRVSKFQHLRQLCNSAPGFWKGMLTTHLHGVRQGKPDEKMSVKGCGKNYPDPAGAEKLDDGVLVPCGKALDSSLHFKSSLLYNEVSMCVDPRICMFASSCMSRVGSVYLSYVLACLGDKYIFRERGGIDFSPVNLTFLLRTSLSCTIPRRSSRAICCVSSSTSNRDRAS